MRFRLKKFLFNDIWTKPYSSSKKIKSFSIKILKIILITVQSISNYEVSQGAGFLVFYSSFTIIPCLIFLFRIARFFFYNINLKDILISSFEKYEPQINYIFELSNNKEYSASSSLILISSLIVIFWSLIVILINMEYSLNRIWKVHNPPTAFFRKLCSYITIVVISPIIFFICSGAILYISKTLPFIWPEIFSIKTSVILNAVSYITTYIFICLLLSAFYLFLPSEQVLPSAALKAGFITGSFYLILQFWYFSIQLKLIDYNFTYGALALLPIFLIWLYFNWLLFLIGGALSYAIQNYNDFIYPDKKENLGFYNESILLTLVMSYCSYHYLNKLSPPTIEDISKYIKMPFHYTQKIVSKLVSNDLLAEVKNKKKGFLPTFDICQTTLCDLLNNFTQRSQKYKFHKNKMTEEIIKSFEEMDNNKKNSKSNKLIIDIIKNNE